MLHGKLAQRAAIVIAKRLLQDRNPDSVAALLTSVAQQSRELSLELIRMLAETAYSVQGWGEAAELWSHIAEQQPDDFEANLKAAHALFETGNFDEAELYKQRLQRASSWGSEDVDRLLDPLYLRILDYFNAQDEAFTGRLIELSRLPGSYSDRIRGADVPDISDSKIQAQLSFARDQCERIPTTVQPSQNLAGRRVMLVLRKYFFGGSKSRLHELTEYIGRSATDAGIRTAFFMAEPFRAAKGKITPEQQYRCLDALVTQITEFRPEILIMDELGQPAEDPEFLGPEVFKDVLSHLRVKFGCRIVALYQDSWHPNVLRAMDFAADYADLLWFQNLRPPYSKPDQRFGRPFMMPFPLPDAVFARSGIRRDITAGFSGSVVGYNYLRAIWIAGIRQAAVPCEVFLTRHFTKESAGGDDVDSYAAFLARMRMVVNFSARRPWSKVMTGRVWESILSGALLLEEENDETAKYLLPFVHYIPFNSVPELQAYISFFDRHETRRNQITTAARQWYLSRYSKEIIWSNLFEAASAGSKDESRHKSAAELCTKSPRFP